MDQLWAPWRLEYVVHAKSPPPRDGCFLCQSLAETKDRANWVVLRTPLSVVVLNRFPYNNGHLLVAPRAHKGRLQELEPAEILESQQALGRMMDLLDELMHPDGYNVGLNLGRAAGAGLPGHLHWHVVPRWEGDTNFMPVVNDVKVIVQSLASLYDLLTARIRAGA
jgi:ATP adenylyltransferase